MNIKRAALSVLFAIALASQSHAQVTTFTGTSRIHGLITITPGNLTSSSRWVVDDPVVGTRNMTTTGLAQTVLQGISTLTNGSIAGLTINGNLSVTGTSVLSGLLTTSAGIATTSASLSGNLTVTGNATVGTLTANVGATTPIVLGRNNPFTTVTAISLNGVLTDTGLAGFFGESSGNVYINTPARILFRPGGTGTVSVVCGTNGTLGIGAGNATTNPVYPLDIAYSTTTPVVRIRNTLTSGYSAITAMDTANTYRFSAGYGNSTASVFTSASYISTGASTDLVLATNDTERMRLTSTGNFGISTTSANSSLHVAGSFASAIRSTTTNGNITATDNVVTGTGAITLTLPTAVSITGREYVIKNIGGVTLTAGSAGGTIDAATTQAIINGAGSSSSMRFKSDGTNWIIIQ
jgi:hypothetical protein